MINYCIFNHIVRYLIYWYFVFTSYLNCINIYKNQTENDDRYFLMFVFHIQNIRQYNTPIYILDIEYPRIKGTIYVARKHHTEIQQKY